MISGFQATMTINDGGNGAAPGGAATAFAGLVTLNLPEIDAPTFEGTELNQSADQYEREFPTGLLKVGPIECTMKYTKANYTRLQTLITRGRGYTIVLTTPDDLSSGSPVILVATFTGFLKKLGAVQFEKNNPVTIPFTLVIQSKPTSYA